MKIEIFTFLTRYSAPYADLLQRSMEKLKSGDHKITYRYIESVGLDSTPTHWEYAGKAGEKGHNCYNHAEAMNKAITLLTGDVIIFVDADMCILYQDWDNVVVDNLIENDIWGTAFRDCDLQYNKFPNVFFFCFNRKVAEKVNLDFYPQIKKDSESPLRLRVDNEPDAKILGKRVGQHVKCDTGCFLPFICKDYRAGYMPMILGKEKNSQLPYKDLDQWKKCQEKERHMAEWHYDGVLFITHKQASRNHPLHGVWGSIWFDRINIYAKKKFGYWFNAI